MRIQITWVVEIAHLLGLALICNLFASFVGKEFLGSLLVLGGGFGT